MRTAFKAIFVSLIFILLNSIAFAQNYYFQQYSLNEGLPQSQVLAITQDSRGVLWVGTNGGGLCRFNGEKFKIYTTRDGLVSNIVSSIFEDQKGNLWIGSNSGLSVYDGIHFKKIFFDSINALQYDQFCEDKNGNIFFRGIYNGGINKIYEFNDKGFTVLSDRFKELNPDKEVRKILITPDNRLLINTSWKILEYKDNRITESEYNNLPEIKGRHVIYILQNRRNDLWIFVEGKNSIKTYVCRGDKTTLINWPGNISVNKINAIYNDSKGNYWVANNEEGKLFQVYGSINSGNFKVFTKENGLPGEIIRIITEDNEGNIWFGTSGAGLFKYSGSKFIAYTKQHGLGDNIIWSIFQDSKGFYWFGTSLNGISRYDGKEFKTFQNPAEPLNTVRTITENPDGTLLIGSGNGLWNFNGTSFTHINNRYNIPGRNTGINDILQDHGTYWFATNAGLYMHAGNTDSLYSLKNKSLPNNMVNNVIKDKSGNIWVATGGGISIITGKKIIQCNTAEGLSNRNVMQLSEDHNGNIWAATYGGGICRITLNAGDSLSVKTFDSRQGLSSDNVYSLLTDPQGNLWAGCQNGVDKITLDEHGNIVSVRSYDKYEGFTGIENNGQANYIDRNGRLWFGTIAGVMEYNPQVDVINSKPPVTSITAVKLFYKNVNWENPDNAKFTDGVLPWNNLPVDLELPYNRNHLSFEFEGLSYKVPEKVRFQWKLDGVDKDWSPVTTESEVIYSNLNPGSYTFYVKASNNDGVWNDSPVSYSFVIQSPFWQTWWFRGLLFIFFLSLTIIVFWLRNRMVREKQEELEQLVAFKTKKLEDQKNEILVQRDKLERSYENLELLSKIGREITANLTVEAIIESVYDRLNNLMDASVFGLGIVDTTEAKIYFPVLINSGVRMEAITISLHDTSNFAAVCVNEKKEIIIGNYFKEFEEHKNNWIRPNLEQDASSIIYLPLNHDDNPLGVLTVQSYRENAFQEYHLHIIRNLAVYARIALENARTYEKMQEQKNRLARANSSITRQKEEIERKNIELQELNNEKNHIISIVAHDLRNPLTSALTMTGLLKSDADPENEDQLVYSGAIEKSLNRMNEMIVRLLDIRKLEDKAFDLRPEKINLEKIIREVNRNMRAEFDRKQIKFNLESEELYVNLDRDFTTQIFENLLSNAIKFSPPKTSIQVRLRKENGYARAEIKDEGPGLTADDMKKLFGKFQRLSARPTGGEHSTGLGLSIVKKYVEAMNGKVWCESEPGKGANFIVEFARM